MDVGTDTQELKSEFLFGLSPDEINEAQAYFEQAEYLKGAVLLHEGVVGQELILVTSGRVSVKVGGQYVCNFGRGKVVGEISLIDQKERTASVFAETDVTVLKLSTSSWLRMQKEKPSIAVRLSFNLNSILADKFRRSATLVHTFQQLVKDLKHELDEVSFKKVVKILSKPLF